MQPTRQLLVRLIAASVLAGLVLGLLLSAYAPTLPPAPSSERLASADTDVDRGTAAEPLPPLPSRRARPSDAVPDERMTPIAPPSGHSAESMALAYGDGVLPGAPTVGRDGRLRAVAFVETNFRSLVPDWRAVVESRFAGAGDLLRTAAGIELSLAAEPFEWEPSRRWLGLEDLLGAIESDAAPRLHETGATLAVGISAQVGDLSTGSMCGIARDLRNTCVVLDLMGVDDADGLGRVTLAHEIGHCFGCFHVPEETSIMVPRVGQSMPDHFDPANREVLALTKGYDISRGERDMPERVLRRIADLARQHGVEGEHNPGAEAFDQRAYRTLVESGDAGETARLARISLDYEPGRTYARYNLAVALGRLGKRYEARRELGRAMREDPALASKREAQRLQEALDTGRPLAAGNRVGDGP